MDSTDPLSQLADIHLPEPVGIWPPAPGWWILLIILVIAGVIIGRRYYAGWKQRRICAFAVRELDKCVSEYRAAKAADPQKEEDDTLKLNFVNEVNAVLRRVALKHFPGELPASLSGEQWIAYLRNKGDASLLDDSLAATLVQGRFARRWDVDDEHLYRMAHQWITSLYFTKIGSDKASENKSTSTPVSNHA